MLRPHSVCVFCGSRAGARPAYREAAQAMGRAMGENGWRLVYGAGDVGLMGTVAAAAQDAGARTFGVIPEHLLPREVGRSGLDTFVVTQDMHERKKVMFMNSDVIAILPGGAGSLDEFFEVLTWAQIGLHAKPIVLVDVDGYWSPLVALVEHVIAEGFAGESLADLFQVAPDVEGAVAMLAP
ncbi:MAG: LOG family protein [Shimia sp.]